MPDPDPLNLPRRWWAVPIAACVLLLALRALLHDVPLERLATADHEPRDPPGTVARAGSIDVARGGPVIVGFQSSGPARLVIGTHEILGSGLAKERIVMPAGIYPIRFAAPHGGGRLLWSPVGRRGDPEYLPASSLSPDPAERATFDRPGTATLDGEVAALLLVIIVASAALAARRRLATVSRETWLAMAAILAGALAVRLIGLGDEGQTWDEDVYWAAGRNYVTNLLSLDFSDSSWLWNFEHPPLTKYLAGIGAQFGDGYGPARALSALWGALACALLVPIGTRIFDRATGVLAGAIAALLPPLIAHAQIVGHESPTQLLWALGILLALTVHDQPPLLRRLIGVGIVIGLAASVRFVNAFLGPVCVAIVIIEAPTGARIRAWLLGTTVMAIAALLTIYVVWPRLWLHPIGNLEASFAKLSITHAPEPFLGELTVKPSAAYFLVYLAATLPVGALLASVLYAFRVGLAALGALAVHQLQLIRAHAIVVVWLLVPLVGLMASPVRQDGVRYVMPCVLALALIAAAGVTMLARFVPSRRVATVGVVLCLYLAITVARTRPYYLDYFNEVTGGAGAVARGKTLETAWWGEGLDRAIAYVNDHADRGATIYKDCVEPGHLAWLREDLWTHLARDPAKADWIVVYAPDTRSCRLPADAREVYQVGHDGVTLAAVYRRGL